MAAGGVRPRREPFGHSIAWSRGRAASGGGADAPGQTCSRVVPEPIPRCNCGEGSCPRWLRPFRSPGADLAAKTRSDATSLLRRLQRLSPWRHTWCGGTREPLVHEGQRRFTTLAEGDKRVAALGKEFCLLELSPCLLRDRSRRHDDASVVVEPSLDQEVSAELREHRGAVRGIERVRLDDAYVVELCREVTIGSEFGKEEPPVVTSRPIPRGCALHRLHPVAEQLVHERDSAPHRARVLREDHQLTCDLDNITREERALSQFERVLAPGEVELAWVLGRLES